MSTSITIHLNNPSQETSPDLSFLFGSDNIRIQSDNTGKVWFCALDVCHVLGYKDSSQAIRKNCKEKGRSSRRTLTAGGYQSVTYIDEGNLYRLIVKSRKPQAESFEEWVFDEVIPSIRKTGSYQHTLKPDHDRITSAQYKALSAEIESATKRTLMVKTNRTRLHDFLKFLFDVTTLTALKSADYDKAMEQVRSVATDINHVRGLLADMEVSLIKKHVLGNAPMTSTLKKRYRDDFEAMHSGNDVDWKQLAAKMYFDEVFSEAG